jgi:hypothetical protein
MIEPDNTNTSANVKIVTDFWAKPIPLRQFDWQAVTDNYEGGDAIGYGATEQEAILDLQAQLEEQ